MGGGGEKKRDYKRKRMRTKNDVSIYIINVYTHNIQHIYIYIQFYYNGGQLVSTFNHQLQFMP